MKRPASVLDESEPLVWPIPSIEPYYVRASGPGVYATPEGEFGGVEYEIVRQSQQRGRKDRSAWSKPLKLSAPVDPKGRVDLHVRFSQKYQKWNTLYNRVVALTLLKCYWNASGELSGRPYSVSPRKWDQYHVHHLDANTWNVSLSNLAILPKRLHEGVTAGTIKLKMPRVWPYKGARSSSCYLEP